MHFTHLHFYYSQNFDWRLFKLIPWLFLYGDSVVHLLHFPLTIQVNFYHYAFPESCPPITEHSNVTKSTELAVYGTSVSFSCTDGYTLEGVKMMSCEEDGQWSSQEMPVCIRMCLENYDIVCVIYYCCTSFQRYSLSLGYFVKYPTL